MGELSIWHWLVVIAVVMLLFGRGKMSGLMGDLAQGIKAFKKTMSEDEPPAQTRNDTTRQSQIEAPAVQPEPRVDVPAIKSP
jgi:sec-independent protein translocase protein TatA